MIATKNKLYTDFCRVFFKWKGSIHLKYFSVYISQKENKKSFRIFVIHKTYKPSLKKPPYFYLFHQAATNEACDSPDSRSLIFLCGTGQLAILKWHFHVSVCLSEVGPRRALGDSLVISDHVCHEPELHTDHLQCKYRGFVHPRRPLPPAVALRLPLMCKHAPRYRRLCNYDSFNFPLRLLDFQFMLILSQILNLWFYQGNY